MAYVTLAQAKEYMMPDSATDTDDDALLTELITRASDAIDNYTGRTFAAAADTSRYYVVGEDTEGAYLYFDKDIASITSIVNGDSVTVQSTEYVTIPRNDTPYQGVKLIANSGVSWQYSDDPDEDPITVTGKWAYSTAAPEPVELACLILVKDYYDKRTITGGERDQVTSGGVVIRGSGMPASVRELLLPYRKVT